MVDAPAAPAAPVAPAADAAPLAPAAGSSPAADGAAPAAGAPAAPAADAAPVQADWRSSITDPEHVEFAKRLTSPADAVKVALDLRKLNGAMIKVPGKDATPEDRAKFNKAIGVPESAEGYTFDLGREATEADKAIQVNLAKVAFENGVPATAMSALTKAVAELAGAQKAEENRIAIAGREATDAALRKELGGDYEAHKVLSQRAIQAFGEIKGHPEVLEFFEHKTVDGIKIGDHPVMRRIMGNVGRRMGEGEFIGAVGADQRQSLQAEWNQILATTPPGTAGYAKPEVQKRITEISEALHGTEGIVGAAGRSA